MISSFRNFAKTKFAGLLVFIMIIPFVFWGMGSMFSSGNTNNIAKINKTNISTKEFIDSLPKDIRESIEENTEVVFRPNKGPQVDFLAAPEKVAFEIRDPDVDITGVIK